jgi:hypothetical protein
MQILVTVIGPTQQTRLGCTQLPSFMATAPVCPSPWLGFMARLIMNKIDFLKILNFPKIWAIQDLLPDSYFDAAKEEYNKEYGEAIPKDGTEHWRFAAFVYLLRSELSASQIGWLIDAAIDDPDRPMAGGVIEELLSRSVASEQMLAKACEAVERNKYYYKSSEQLKKSFRSAQGPYAIKP